MKFVHACSTPAVRLTFSSIGVVRCGCAVASACGPVSLNVRASCDGATGVYASGGKTKINHAARQRTARSTLWMVIRADNAADGTDLEPGLDFLPLFGVMGIAKDLARLRVGGDGIAAAENILR